MLVPRIEMKTTAVTLGAAQWVATKRLAKRHKVSAAAIFREALDQFLDREGVKSAEQ